MAGTAPRNVVRVSASNLVHSSLRAGGSVAGVTPSVTAYPHPALGRACRAPMYVRLISDALLTTSKSQSHRFCRTNVTRAGEPGMTRALLITIDSSSRSVVGIEWTSLTGSLRS